jgi:hypothetical protein
LSELRTYTVFALSTEDSVFLVAGVLEGEHRCADAEPSSWADDFTPYYRFATSVQASDCDEAEKLAEEEFRESI